MHPAAEAFAESVRGALIAAVATPMTADRETDAMVTRRYFSGIVAGGADGLAVAVHTGRGSMLDLQTKTQLVEIAASLSPIVVAGVSSGREPDPLAWPLRAAAAGASALLVFPAPHRPVAATLRHLDQLWDATSLPLIAFDLYSHPTDLTDLRRILEHPAVAALKPARLFDAVACQDAIAVAHALGRAVLTGEDRMFGPSFMWGADGALVGIAAAAVDVTSAAVSAHRERNAERFLLASSAVDTLAASTFREPWDGYVQRMLWIAADEGLIPAEFAVDPARAPGLADTEREAVVDAARLARTTIDGLSTRRR